MYIILYLTDSSFVVPLTGPSRLPRRGLDAPASRRKGPEAEHGRREVPRPAARLPVAQAGPEPQVLQARGQLPRTCIPGEKGGGGMGSPKRFQSDLIPFANYTVPTLIREIVIVLLRWLQIKHPTIAMGSEGFRMSNV